MADLGEVKGLIDLDSKVSPIILAGILDINVSLIYQEMQVGRLPNPVTEATYRECVLMYIKHFKKNADLRILKEENSHAMSIAKLDEASKLKLAKVEASSKATRSFGGDDSDGGMPPIMMAKYKQDIRLNIARETQLWIKASIERGEYISMEELVEVIEPFMMSIRQTLMQLALLSDDAESAVDLAMDTLHDLGNRLVADADTDKSNFIKEVLAKEIIPEEIEIDAEPPRLL